MEAQDESGQEEVQTGVRNPKCHLQVLQKELNASFQQTDQLLNDLEALLSESRRVSEKQTQDASSPGGPAKGDADWLLLSTIHSGEEAIWSSSAAAAVLDGMAQALWEGSFGGGARNNGSSKRASEPGNTGAAAGGSNAGSTRNSGKLEVKVSGQFDLTGGPAGSSRSNTVSRLKDRIRSSQALAAMAQTEDGGGEGDRPSAGRVAFTRFELDLGGGGSGGNSGSSFQPMPPPNRRGAPMRGLPSRNSSQGSLKEMTLQARGLNTPGSSANRLQTVVPPPAAAMQAPANLSDAGLEALLVVGGDEAEGAQAELGPGAVGFPGPGLAPPSPARTSPASPSPAAARRRASLVVTTSSEAFDLAAGRRPSSYDLPSPADVPRAPRSPSRGGPAQAVQAAEQQHSGGLPNRLGTPGTGGFSASRSGALKPTLQRLINRALPKRSLSEGGAALRQHVAQASVTAAPSAASSGSVGATLPSPSMLPLATPHLRRRSALMPGEAEAAMGLTLGINIRQLPSMPRPGSSAAGSTGGSSQSLPKLKAPGWSPGPQEEDLSRAPLSAS